MFEITRTKHDREDLHFALAVLPLELVVGHPQCVRLRDYSILWEISALSVIEDIYAIGFRNEWDTATRPFSGQLRVKAFRAHDRGSTHRLQVVPEAMRLFTGIERNHVLRAIPLVTNVAPVVWKCSWNMMYKMRWQFPAVAKPPAPTIAQPAFQPLLIDVRTPTDLKRLHSRAGFAKATRN